MMLVRQFVFLTHLDDFGSSVSHSQGTGVETRGGREDVQLAHLVHTTETHTQKVFQSEQLDNQKLQKKKKVY